MTTATCPHVPAHHLPIHHRIPETPNTACLEAPQECGLETMTFRSLARIPTHLQIMFLRFFLFYACLHHSPQKDAIDNDKSSESVCQGANTGQNMLL